MDLILTKGQNVVSVQLRWTRVTDEIRFNYGDKFTQTSDTNTGIGSTIPAGKLDVAGTASAGSLRVSGIATFLPIKDL